MKIIIDGNPIPKARHKTSRYSTYDPQHVKKEETFWEMRSQALSISKENPLALQVLNGPLMMHIIFFMQAPYSYTDRKRESLYGQPHHKKPDLSNLIKFYEDCANTILYKDDAQICKIEAQKIYDKKPRTEITISQFIVPKVKQLQNEK